MKIFTCCTLAYIHCDVIMMRLLRICVCVSVCVFVCVCVCVSVCV